MPGPKASSSHGAQSIDSSESSSSSPPSSEQLENAESGSSLEIEPEIEQVESSEHANESSDVQPKFTPKAKEVIGTTRKMPATPMTPVTIPVPLPKINPRRFHHLMDLPFSAFPRAHVPLQNIAVPISVFHQNRPMLIQPKHLGPPKAPPPRVNIHPMVHQESQPDQPHRVDEQTLQSQHAHEWNSDEETPFLEPQPDPIPSPVEVEMISYVGPYTNNDEQTGVHQPASTFHETPFPVTPTEELETPFPDLQFAESSEEQEKQEAVPIFHETPYPKSPTEVVSEEQDTQEETPFYIYLCWFYSRATIRPRIP